jgi:hypothetical protein
MSSLTSKIFSKCNNKKISLILENRNFAKMKYEKLAPILISNHLI